ncbi:hypothetical protein M3231_08315 [Neobacillus mesonae]|nr:hypothetical protein [Neobacillus mesonae]
MSLTSLINTDSAFQEIIREVTPKASDFQSNIEIPPFKNKHILADAQFTSYVSGLIRTSFQYLFCAMTARNNKDNPSDALNLHAVKGHEVINEFFADVPETNILNELFTQFMAAWEGYIEGHSIDPSELISGVFMCSKLDTIYRVGVRSSFTSTEQFVKQFTSPPTKDVIEDLNKLMYIFNEHFTDIYGTTIYHPSFDKTRRLVGGAHADIIIDGTLYEIKTNKKPGYAWKEAAELLSYYLLNMIEGKPYPIRQLAFYRARFGTIEYVDVDQLEKKFDLGKAANMLGKTKRIGFSSY